MEMILRTIAYITGISFQLAAALSLIDVIDTKPESIVKRVIKGCDGGNHKLEDRRITEKKEIAVVAETAYRNKTSFYLLFFGFLLNVFGLVPDGMEWQVIVGITILTVIIFIAVLEVSRMLAYKLAGIEK